jgi:hypothetical protein
MLKVRLYDIVLSLRERHLTFRNNRVLTSYLILLYSILVNMPEICESIEMPFLRCFLVVLNRIFNLFATILVSLLKKLGWIHQSFL